MTTPVIQFYCHDCDCYFSFDNDEDFALHSDHKFTELKEGVSDPGLLKDFKQRGIKTEATQEEEPKLAEFAELIMKKYKFKTMSDTKEIFYYSGGVYKPQAEVIILEECEKIIPECSRYKVGEVIAIIQRRSFVDRDKFNRDLKKLVFENGILNLDTGEFTTEFDSEFLTTVKMPYEYNVTATCKKFCKLLEDCLGDKEKIITSACGL